MIRMMLMISFIITFGFIQNVSAEIVYARVADVIMRDESVYDPGCVVPINVGVVALGSRGDPFFVVLSAKHQSNSTWVSLAPARFEVWKSTEMARGIINYWIPKNATAGLYSLKISVFDGYQKDDGAVILKKIFATKEIPGAFEVIYDARSGCISKDYLHDTKEKPMIVYEVKPDGLYVNGTKVTQEQQEPSPVNASDTLQSIPEDEVLKATVMEKNDASDELAFHYLMLVLVFVATSVVILKKIRKKP